MSSDSPQESFARPALPDALEIVITGRARDLVGGFQVRRVLPYSQRRMVGPFIFLDQMGPEVLRAGAGLDVAPHPHIRLATVTYLFEGELLHRDSLVTVQIIRPGEVNWMTLGSGIAHSERTPPGLRQTGSKLFGLQSWVALPTRDEEMEPTFAHHGTEELPIIKGEGKRVRLIAGSLYGARSSVATRSEMFYADVTLEAGAKLPLPTEHEERAVYVVAGSIGLADHSGAFNAGELLVFKPDEAITINARRASSTRLILLGGAPLDGPRHIWWNFVSSSKERIKQAKEDWQSHRFAPAPEETEFIPLPESRPISLRGIPRQPPMPSS
ncbi:MAG: pirin family protein [Acidobacteriota bacterium]|nr:pirin family protein [Acidobacteriota bacterium]